MRLTIVSVALALLIGGCATPPPVGSEAPNFAAVDSTGREISLASFADTVLILDFWAVW